MNPELISAGGFRKAYSVVKILRVISVYGEGHGIPEILPSTESVFIRMRRLISLNKHLLRKSFRQTVAPYYGGDIHPGSIHGSQYLSYDPLAFALSAPVAVLRDAHHHLVTIRGSLAPLPAYEDIVRIVLIVGYHEAVGYLTGPSAYISCFKGSDYGFSRPFNYPYDLSLGRLSPAPRSRHMDLYPVSVHRGAGAVGRDIILLFSILRLHEAVPRPGREKSPLKLQGFLSPASLAGAFLFIQFMFFPFDLFHVLFIRHPALSRSVMERTSLSRTRCQKKRSRYDNQERCFRADLGLSSDSLDVKHQSYHHEKHTQCDRQLLKLALKGSSLILAPVCISHSAYRSKAGALTLLGKHYECKRQTDDHENNIQNQSQCRHIYPLPAKSNSTKAYVNTRKPQLQP